MIEDVFDCKAGKATKRAMSPEREAAFLAQQAKDTADKQKRRPSADERIAALDARLAALEA